MRKILDVAPLSAKNQITVPKSVRQKLGIEREGKIAFYEDGDRIVVEAVI